MGRLDESCKTIVSRVDGAMSCGVVDLDTGALIGVHNNATASPPLGEASASATASLLRGRPLAAVRMLLSQQRDLPVAAEPSFEEVLISSERCLHFAKRLPGGRAVVVLVTERVANVGMRWAQLKSLLPELEPLVP